MHQIYERDEEERYINVKVVWLEKSAIDSCKLLSLLRFGYIQTITFLYLYILNKNLKVSQRLMGIGFVGFQIIDGNPQLVYSVRVSTVVPELSSRTEGPYRHREPG